MSLPNYLAKIKSSGIYRFVWDKSQVPPQQAETLRLVVGYSEKGPFNTPVYVESESDFTTIYGNISKRLERRGVYFHRLAQQALQVGPILALNLKPFGTETVKYINFNAGSVDSVSPETKTVADIFDTSRFWALDPDKMVEKLNETNYITIAATDTKENSCTVFMRKYAPESYDGITFRSWYSSQGIEVPEYMAAALDKNVNDYFVEIYVFRGNFDKTTMSSDPFKTYFDNDSIKTSGYDGDALADLATDSNSNFIGYYSGITVPYFKDANGNYISIDLKFNSDQSKHKMLMKLDELKLTDTEFESQMVFTENASVKPIYIEGYTYSTIGAADNIWNKCKELLTSGGIHEALTNRVDVDYHYIVDTFDSKSETTTKSELFKLAKKKDNAFAIVNFPKMSLFSLTNGMKSAVNGFKTNMPSEIEGASWGAYYTQLTFSDGAVKTVIPSAALVSNLFMDKWGARQPYYIVAGPNYGRLSYSGLIGPDFNFGRSDLDVLEPMGVNAIVYVPRKGTYINSNQTAKQIPVSGLSKIHIRELVIYLQNEIENLLQSYQWELNTQALRDTIRSKADAICDTIMNNGGLYAYKNVCDETNNTPEVIDNEMIVLDTEIEPARGAGKMVHQLTIHKTGALSSSVK